MSLEFTIVYRQNIYEFATIPEIDMILYNFHHAVLPKLEYFCLPNGVTVLQYKLHFNLNYVFKFGIYKDMIQNNVNCTAKLCFC